MIVEEFIARILNAVLDADSDRKTYWPKDVVLEDINDQGIICGSLDLDGERVGFSYSGTTIYDKDCKVVRVEPPTVSDYDVSHSHSLLRLSKNKELVCAVFAAPWNTIVDSASLSLKEFPDLVIGYLKDKESPIEWAWEGTRIFPMIGRQGNRHELILPDDGVYEWVLMASLAEKERSAIASLSTLSAEQVKELFPQM